MAPRPVDFRAEEKLRNRTLDLLKSFAAQQVRFNFHTVPFSGGTGFPKVADAIKALKIGFRTGNVPDKAGAAYRTNLDLIDVQNYEYGKQPSEEQDLIHECFHAWRDIQGKKTSDADGKDTATYAVTDEAMAYITGALFVMYRSGTTAAPSWSSPIREVAHKVAAKLVVKKGSVLVPVSDPTVPLPDVWALWSAILSSPTYENLKDDPDQEYGNNGV